MCGLGCGSGQVAGYLHDQAVTVIVVDLSPGMLGEAQRLNPDIDFQQGTMMTLPFDDGSLAGIAAFYSIIHIPRPQLSALFREMRPALRPDGAVLVAFHIGDEDRHLEDWRGQPVSLDFQFYRPQDIANLFIGAGFAIVESLEGDPYPEVEHPSRRAYILLRKPEDATGTGAQVIPE